jgi:hypothetical protein
VSVRKSPLNIALGLLALSAASAQVKVPSAAPPESSQNTVSRPLPPSQKYSLGSAPRVELGPISESVRDQPSPLGLLRVATQRVVAATQMDQGVWQKTASGSVWRLDIRSTNAVGIRIHFTNFSVGAGEVWVHDTSNPARKVVGAYTAKGRNENGDFWTEIIFSDTIEVEYQPATGNATSGRPPFLTAELSHLWQFGKVIAPRQTAQTGTVATSQTPEASTSATLNFQCDLDASCYSDPASSNYVAAVGQAVRSTALIVFSDSSGTFQCSATLLNAPNASPLLLTAGHCINAQTDAQSMVAIFNTVDETCQQPPFTVATNAQLNALPQVNGIQLLSYSDQAFLDETSESQINNDLDYSLVLLDNFPSWPNALLSGYTDTPVSAGAQLTSVSAPQGLFLKVAFSTVLPSSWANGFDVDQTSAGRIDSGSSGSGIFDNTGALVGLLSTGSSPCANPSNCPNLTSCDVRGAFTASYTAFSVIYPVIRTYLNQPLTTPGTTVVGNSGVFSASTITNINAQGLGNTTLTMNAPSSVTQVEIHVKTPDGPLLYGGVGQGTATATGWVSNGMVFYLQNVSSNQPLTLANTLATATAYSTAVTLTATPPVILFPNALGFGSMTLNWTVPGSRLLEVHIGLPSGTLFTQQSGPSGSARASGWVSNGLTFVLCDVSNGACSTQNTVATLTAKVAQDSQGTVDPGGGSPFVSSPNPIPVAAGQLFGQTTLYFDVPGASTLRSASARQQGRSLPRWLQAERQPRESGSATG